MLPTQKTYLGEYIGKAEIAVKSRAMVCFLLLACLMIFSSVSMAAVPAAVTTAITDAVADVGTIGAAILGVIVVIASFAWMRRPIR